MEDILIMPFSEISAVWVAIFAILGTFAAGIAAMVLRSKEKERAHKERMFLAEKGMEIPRELYAPQKTNKDKKPGHFRTARAWLIVLGTTMVFIGVAVMIALTISEDIRSGINGLTPTLIGVAFLVAERMLGSFAAQSKRESDLAE